MNCPPKNTIISAAILTLAIFSSVALGAPTSSPQAPLRSATLQKRDTCPPCWDGTRSGCKPLSYITKQAADEQTSLYYTCTSDEWLTTYYTCDGGCSGEGVCNNGQLYGYYTYKFVVPVGGESTCPWAA